MSGSGNKYPRVSPAAAGARGRAAAHSTAPWSAVPTPAHELREWPVNSVHRPDEERKVDALLRWLPLTLWVVSAAMYSLLSLTRFNLLATPSWDNAIFQQAIDGYAHLQAPIVDIKGPGYNILGDHFSPILAVLAPIYGLFPHAQTLLVAQAVLITSSVVPITQAAVGRLGAVAGTSIAVAYMLSFGIQSAVYTDFHEMAFAAPIMAFAGRAYLNRRWWAVAGWAAPLLLVKEDLGVTVAAVGLVLAFTAGAQKVGAALVGVGLVGAVVTLLLIIPAFNQSGTFDYWTAVSFGPAGPGPVRAFLTGWDVKAVTLLLTFGITGFLAIRSPWVLVAAPTLAWRWVGTNPEYWDTNWHYSLIVMPIVFIAFIDGSIRIRKQRKSPSWLRGYANHAPTAALAVALVLIMQFPLSNLFKFGTYRPDSTDVAASSAAVALIPKGASVETDLKLITHLVDDFHVYWVGTIGTFPPDYVLIHPDDQNTTTVVGYAQDQHPGHTYRQIYNSDGYQLARRIN